MLLAVTALAAPAWAGHLVLSANDGKYILVQNYVEKELAAYRVTASGPEDTGVRVKVNGHPASIRIAPR